MLKSRKGRPSLGSSVRSSACLSEVVRHSFRLLVIDNHLATMRALASSVRAGKIARAGIFRASTKTAPLHVRLLSYGREFVFQSPFEDVDIPPVAIDEYATANIEAFGDKLALKDVTTGNQVTFSDMSTMVKSLSYCHLPHFFFFPRHLAAFRLSRFRQRTMPIGRFEY